MATTRPSTDRAPGPSLVGPVLVHGFTATVAVWVTWFITHLPWLKMPESVSVPLILGVWVAVAAACARSLPRSQPRRQVIGALSGFVAALTGLLVLGSKLKPPAAPTGEVTGTLPPSVGLIVVGFLVLGTVIGLVGSALGTAMSARDHREPEPVERSLGRLALVAVVAIAPLLFVGGLVTSTASGMAVPDWPNTFATNMFLYPIGPRASADVYLEHSHRLFGSLIGLTVLTLMVLTIRVEWSRRRWVCALAIAGFALVCFQGLLGGIRVLEGHTVAAKDLTEGRYYSMAHGVLAQLVFGMFVALAVCLAPNFRRLSRSLGGDAAARVWAGSVLASSRLLRVLATGAVICLVVQLLFGAAYRHFRAGLPLYLHLGFSIVVVVFVLLAAFLARSGKFNGDPAGRTVRLLATGTFHTVILQFVLGWVTFFVGGRDHAAETVTTALIRTAHQANGALLLALSTAVCVWSFRLVTAAREVPAGVGSPAPAAQSPAPTSSSPERTADAPRGRSILTP